jgi:2EXR family
LLVCCEAFYSSTALPTLLHVSRESRHIALQNYDLSFPYGAHPATIFYNPSIDILFFPGWDFKESIRHFELATSTEARAKFKRLAIDAIIWCYRLNNVEQGKVEIIGEFRGLKELLLVQREPDYEPCECGCVPSQADKHEKGVVSFSEEKELCGRYLNRCKKAFEMVIQADREWKIPIVRPVKLLRDGKLV